MMTDIIKTMGSNELASVVKLIYFKGTHREQFCYSDKKVSELIANIKI